jgi:hypothetical protein
LRAEVELEGDVDIDSGRRADTLSVRSASQGVKNDVDSTGGEDTGVVNRI